MTAPLPDGDEFPVSPDAPKRTSSSAAPKRKNIAPSRATLARKWAYLVTGTAYLPYTNAQIEEHFAALLDEVFAAVRSEDAEPAQAAEAGARLVALRCVGPDSLRRTMDVLGKGLLHEPELRGVKSLPERVLQVLGALAAGYGEALRESIQTQQEDLSRTLVTLERETRRELVLTQARFEQLFTGSATGVAVTRVDGRVQRVNPAFAEMLNRPVADLAGLNLYDLVHPDDADGLREGYRKLLDGESQRLELSRRLVAEDEEPTWAGFTGAVIRDPSGEAQQLITLVAGDTDVSLLQRQLSRQALHDPLTGLPNRQCFGTRLERALRHADPSFGVTVYHLDLDGFSLIAGGLGQKQSDDLLKNVAAKLRAVVGGEDALVARIGGDEFGILIQNTAASPDVATVIGMINHELSEPVYLDSGSGVAVSACIGVVHRPPRDIAPNELLRVSGMTLRRAQANGYRQWALSDSVLDTRERHEFGLAVSMAGAWETGQLEVSFRPLTWLADSRPHGYRGEARVEPPAPRPDRSRHLRPLRRRDRAHRAAGRMAHPHRLRGGGRPAPDGRGTDSAPGRGSGSRRIGAEHPDRDRDRAVTAAAGLPHAAPCSPNSAKRSTTCISSPRSAWTRNCRTSARPVTSSASSTCPCGRSGSRPGWRSGGRNRWRNARCGTSSTPRPWRARR